MIASSATAGMCSAKSVTACAATAATPNQTPRVDRPLPRDRRYPRASAVSTNTGSASVMAKRGNPPSTAASRYSLWACSATALATGWRSDSLRPSGSIRRCEPLPAPPSQKPGIWSSVVFQRGVRSSMKRSEPFALGQPTHETAASATIAESQKVRRRATKAVPSSAASTASIPPREWLNGMLASISPIPAATASTAGLWSKSSAASPKEPDCEEGIVARFRLVVRRPTARPAQSPM